MFDAILTFDVLEHVQDLRKPWRMLRVLKRMQVVPGFPELFPSNRKPSGIGYDSPCIHWFFSGETLLKAYCEILENGR